MAATPPNRKFARISATLWLPKTKLGHVHRDSVWSGQNKFGVICPLGGAIINKIAYLLICLCKNHMAMIHQAVAQSIETWLRCELISWELFDVWIIPLIARLAWAPHCCLQLWGPCSDCCLQGTLCVSTFSYYYYYSSFFCHGMSMAAHRTVCQKVVKFGTQVKDSCMFNFTQLHVANKHALAPPTGQSFRYICAHNFWPVGPIFKNKVPLDSLDHADFNAPYDVIMRHNRFSAIFDFVESAKKVSRVAIFDWFSWKSTQTIFRPIRTKVIEWIFQCRLCLPATANQIWRRRRRFRCELISRERFDISK